MVFYIGILQYDFKIYLMSSLLERFRKTTDFNVFIPVFQFKNVGILKFMLFLIFDVV